MKILKNKPLPKSRSKYAALLEMEIGDCVEFSIKVILLRRVVF